MKKDNTKRRLTRVKYQKGLRQQKREENITQDFLDLEQFTLFLIDYLVVISVLASIYFLLAACYGIPGITIIHFFISLLLFFFLEFAHSVFVKDLKQNNIQPWDNDVRLISLIKVVKSIKSLF